MLETPVLFIIFNRPDTTARVLERILQAGVTDLYVAADGPRKSRPGEDALCAKTRALIDGVRPPVWLHTLFREANLGCRAAVSSALSWFFSHVEQGIIVEDDVLPDPSFFTFCQAGLRKYRNEPQIRMISGQNPFGSFPAPHDAVISKFPFIWGWASWRRTWADYDRELASWPSPEDEAVIRNWLKSRHAVKFWFDYFNAIKNGLDTWDVQLDHLLFKNGGLAVVSRTNLVQNIGFHGEATHTRNPEDERQFLTVIPAPASPVFPDVIAHSAAFDAKVVRRLYFKEELTLKGRVKDMLRPLYRQLLK